MALIPSGGSLAPALTWLVHPGAPAPMRLDFGDEPVPSGWVAEIPDLGVTLPVSSDGRVMTISITAEQASSAVGREWRLVDAAGEVQVAGTVQRWTGRSGSSSAVSVRLQTGPVVTVRMGRDGPPGPAGPAGPAGASLVIKGTVPTAGALPGGGNVAGDIWIAEDTGHQWSYTGTSFVDIGTPPPGPPGPVSAGAGPVGDRPDASAVPDGFRWLDTVTLESSVVADGEWVALPDTASDLPVLTGGDRITVDDSEPGFLGVHFDGVDVQTFTEPGVHEWVKPAGVTLCIVTLVGGGGGGGSGRRGAAGSWRYGGGGGASAPAGSWMLPAAMLDPTVSVTVGAGGIGAPGRTTNNTSGGDGGVGGASGFGPLGLSGGTFGFGGTDTGSSGGGQRSSQWVLGVGGTGSPLQGIGTGGGGHGFGGGGGGGAWINDEDTQAILSGIGGGSTTGAGGNGSAAADPLGKPGADGDPAAGSGGSGGGGGHVGARGGDGGHIGGGGGGGGASLNGTPSGGGGDGGDGWVQIVSI